MRSSKIKNDRMAKRDYYEILGLSKNASGDEIKKAFRTLARKFHPDVNKEPGAEAKFKEINEAYSILSDNQKRAQYDQFGHAGAQFGGGPGGGFQGFDFSDLFRGGGGGGFSAEFGGSPFEDLFESFFGGGGGGRRHAGPRRGDDLRYDVSITLEEAAKGFEKEMRSPPLRRVPHLQRDGSAPRDQPDKMRDMQRLRPGKKRAENYSRELHANNPLP